MMSKKTSFAIQRQKPDFHEWDTIGGSITPHESRARRLLRLQQGLGTPFRFRLVKLETETTIIQIYDHIDR